MVFRFHFDFGIIRTSDYSFFPEQRTKQILCRCALIVEYRYRIFCEKFIIQVPPIQTAQLKRHNAGIQQSRRRQALNVSNCRPSKMLDFTVSHSAFLSPLPAEHPVPSLRHCGPVQSTHRWARCILSVVFSRCARCHRLFGYPPADGQEAAFLPAHRCRPE